MSSDFFAPRRAVVRAGVAAAAVEHSSPDDHLPKELAPAPAYVPSAEAVAEYEAAIAARAQRLRRVAAKHGLPQAPLRPSAAAQGAPAAKRPRVIRPGAVAPPPPQEQISAVAPTGSPCALGAPQKKCADSARHSAALTHAATPPHSRHANDDDAVVPLAAAAQLCDKLALHRIQVPTEAAEFAPNLAQFEQSVLTADVVRCAHMHHHHHQHPPTASHTDERNASAGSGGAAGGDYEQRRASAARSIGASHALAAWHCASAFDTLRTRQFRTMCATEFLGTADKEPLDAGKSQLCASRSARTAALQCCAWFCRELCALDWLSASAAGILDGRSGGVATNPMATGAAAAAMAPGSAEAATLGLGSTDARLRVVFFAFALLCRTPSLCAFARLAARVDDDPVAAPPLRRATAALAEMAHDAAAFLRGVVLQRPRGALAVAALLSLHTAQRQRGTMGQPVARPRAETAMRTFRRVGSQLDAAAKAPQAAEAAATRAKQQRQPVRVASVFLAAAGGGASADAGGGFGTKIDLQPHIVNCHGEYVPLVWPPPAPVATHADALRAIGEYVAHVHAALPAPPSGAQQHCAAHAALGTFADVLEAQMD